MANVVLTQKGLDFVTSATDNDGILIKVGYFLPVYDNRIDGSIRTEATTSAFSAIADDSLTTPFGEILWNISGTDYSQSQDETYLVSASVYGSGATYTSPFQDNSNSVNIYKGVPLSDRISASDMTVDSSTLVWSLTGGGGVAGSNTRPTSTDSDFYIVQDYYPVKTSAGSEELRGNFRCVFQKDVGKVKFNKIALYAVAVNSTGVILENNAFFAECYLNEPIVKNNLATDGFDSLVLDFQIDLHSVSADWENVFYGTSADYWSTVPNGLHSPAKISVGNFNDTQTPNAEPQASVHIGNHRDEDNAWDELPSIRMDYKNEKVVEFSATSADNYSMRHYIRDDLVFTTMSASSASNIPYKVVEIDDGVMNFKENSDKKSEVVGADVIRKDEELLVYSKIAAADNKSYFTYEGSILNFAALPLTTYYLNAEADLVADQIVTNIRTVNSYNGAAYTSNVSVETPFADVSAGLDDTVSGANFLASVIQSKLVDIIDTRGSATLNNNYSNAAVPNVKFWFNSSLRRFEMLIDRDSACYISSFSSSLATAMGIDTMAATLNGTDSSDVFIIAGVTAGYDFGTAAPDSANKKNHLNIVEVLKQKDYEFMASNSTMAIGSKEQTSILGPINLDNLKSVVTSGGYARGGMIFNRGALRNFTLVAGLREGFTADDIITAGTSYTDSSTRNPWENVVYTDGYGANFEIVAKDIYLHTPKNIDGEFGKIYVGGNFSPLNLDDTVSIGTSDNKFKIVAAQRMNIGNTDTNMAARLNVVEVNQNAAQDNDGRFGYNIAFSQWLTKRDGTEDNPHDYYLALVPNPYGSGSLSTLSDQYVKSKLILGQPIDNARIYQIYADSANITSLEVGTLAADNLTIGGNTLVTVEGAQTITGLKQIYNSIGVADGPFNGGGAMRFFDSDATTGRSELFFRYTADDGAVRAGGISLLDGSSNLLGTWAFINFAVGELNGTRQIILPGLNVNKSSVTVSLSLKYAAGVVGFTGGTVANQLNFKLNASLEPGSSTQPLILPILATVSTIENVPMSNAQYVLWKAHPDQNIASLNQSSRTLFRVELNSSGTYDLVCYNSEPAASVIGTIFFGESRG